MKGIRNASAEKIESRACSFLTPKVVRYEKGAISERMETVVQEQMVSLYVNGEKTRDLVCSPWDVRELVAGELYLSGAVSDRGQLLSIEVDEEGGIASAWIRHASSKTGSIKGRIRRSSGASKVIVGLFEKEGSSREKENSRPSFVGSDLKVTPDGVNSGIAMLENKSALFKRTGGVHSAVLADDAGVVAWFEDVGRHSAVDKLAGWCFLNEVDASDKMLLFSGRVPREIMLKVIKLGCPVIVSPGAPTALSIELAELWGVTLIGFAKRGAFNVYSHAERLVQDEGR